MAILNYLAQAEEHSGQQAPTAKATPALVAVLAQNPSLSPNKGLLSSFVLYWNKQKHESAIKKPIPP